MVKVKTPRRLEQQRQHRQGMKASAVLLFRVATLIVSNVSLNVALLHIGQQAHWRGSQYIFAASLIGVLTVFAAIALFCPAAFREAWRQKRSL